MQMSAQCETRQSLVMFEGITQATDTIMLQHHTWACTCPMNRLSWSDLCMQLIAKCETRQSLFNFKAIAQEADAIMLSRGNLGLDVLPEKMALVQKHVIQQCNMLGKPAIVTRVVDTMVSSPRPTR